MELSVKDLLDRINEEGVNSALEEKNKIIEEAKKEASEIIEKAKAEASSIVEEANKSRDLLIEQGESSLQQTARNIRLSIKNELNEMFALALNDKIKSNLNSNDWVSIIKEVIKSVDDKDKVLELSSKLYNSISKDVFASLSVKNVKEHVRLKSGFKLVINNGKAYYDFSDDELVELLKPYLSEGLNRIIGKK